MTVPRLYGPLPLTEERIDRHLQANSPGVYALGHADAGTFVIRRVGRADEDLRSALKPHVGGSYKHFRFAYALSPRDAFEKECHLYHTLAGLDNPIHPTAPKDTDLKCPGCRRTTAFPSC